MYCAARSTVGLLNTLRGVGTELGQNDENRFLTLSTYSNGPELP